MNALATRPLGSGPHVSAIGLGTNNFGREGTATVDLAGTQAVVDAAIDEGITLFDTADIYNAGVSERLIGEALNANGKRDDVLIATKFGHSGAPAPGAEHWGPKGAAEYVRRACDASLTRLQTDRIDLYQMHTPDDSTPIVETLTALDELVRAGKVRAIGHSNFSPEQIAEADRVAHEQGLTAFCSAQDEWSLLRRSIETAKLAEIERVGLGVLPYFPLASGLLTGKYRQHDIPAGTRLAANPQRLTDMLGAIGWDGLERYRALCDGAGISMTEASIGWLLAQPSVSSVIAGATTPEQVRANAAAGRVQLTDDLVAQISEVFPV